MASTPPPPGESDHPIYEDDDEEDDDEDDQNDDVDVDDEEDVEIDVDDDSTSSSLPPPPSASLVTVAVLPTIPSSPPARITAPETKPPQPLDESRRLFQRLWTDEDEIELLNGFLHYTNNRNGSHHHHHHDTTAFYDQIKCRLQLEFNKNQLVEKLRRLKKKYRNVVGKLSSGKEYVFKSPHDQAAFEISKKIWSGNGTILAGVGNGGEFDEFNFTNSSNKNINNLGVLSDVGVGGANGGIDVNSNINSNSNAGIVGNYCNSLEKKVVRPRKRARSGGVKIEERQVPQNNKAELLVDQQTPVGSVPNLVEDTVRGCISPLFKELLNNVVNGSRGGFGGGVGMNGGGMMMMPMGFGGVGGMGFGGVDVVDDKWRKQQILELEVYSKRLELLQEQVKSQLDELRSMGS